MLSCCFEKVFVLDTPSYLNPGSSPKMTSRQHSFVAPRCKLSRPNVLTLLSLVGLIVGVGMGTGLRRYELTASQVSYLRFPGELYARLLSVVVLPLAVACVVRSVALVTRITRSERRQMLDADLMNDERGLRFSAKLAVWISAYFVASTLVAVIIGVIVAVSVKPGRSGYLVEGQRVICHGVVVGDSIADLLRNVFTANLGSALTQTDRTCYDLAEAVGLRTKRHPVLEQNPANATHYHTTVIEVNATGNTAFADALKQPITFDLTQPSLTSLSGFNLLGFIVCSCVVGAILGMYPDRCKNFYSLAVTAQFISTKIAHLIMLVSPVGVLFLTAAAVAQADDFSHNAGSLGLLLASCLIGTCIHGLVILPLVAWVLARINPIWLLTESTLSLVNAFATNSRSLTFPVALCGASTPRKLNQSPSLVLPLATPFNGDGCALHTVVSALFVLQSAGLRLTFASGFGVCLASLLTSISASGLPDLGPVSVAIVINAVGIDSRLAAMVLPVAWLVSRFGTVLSVWSSLVCCAIMSQRYPIRSPDELHPETPNPAAYYTESHRGQRSSSAFVNTEIILDPEPGPPKTPACEPRSSYVRSMQAKPFEPQPDVNQATSQFHQANGGIVKLRNGGVMSASISEDDTDFSTDDSIPTVIRLDVEKK